LDIHALISHLAGNAPGFAARLHAAALDPSHIHSMQDLNRLPVMRKDDMLEKQSSAPPFGGFLACNPGDLKRIFQSPGPLYDPETRTSDYWRWAPALRAAGFRSGEITLNAFGYHLTPAGAMFEEGLLAVGCAVIPGGVGNLEQQVQALHTLRVTGYTGLPSYLKALLEKAAELGHEIALQKAFVTAEPLPPSLRAEINSYGITIRQGYGTAECGNLGYECEFENGWHLPEDALVQVCDLTYGQPLPDGQTGEIVATMFSPNYALVRYGTGDLSSVESAACPCGRSTPRLMGWQGRVGDAVKVRGMFLHPRQLSALMQRFHQVTRWQAVISRQDHKDFLTLQIATPHGAPDDIAAQLVSAAREAIKFNLTAEVVEEESLPPNPVPIKDTRSWD
jgi:phenylacetate-CoA ligase